MLSTKTPRKIAAITIAFLFFLISSFAGAKTADLKKDKNGVTFPLPWGTMKVQVCADRIFRVTAAPTNTLPPLEDFVVTAHWKTVPFTVHESGNVVVIATKQLRARVERPSGAITFLDTTGNVLLREPAEGGKTFAPSAEKSFYQVAQTFESSPDEYLYGLGQYQEGLWNWRGLPRELRQHNTTCAMPMLVSSRGYGLLWDNPSLTDFNPLANEIALQQEDISGTNAATQISSWRGTFTTGAAGEYVFFARSDNNRNEFSIRVSGRQIAAITNYWTPRSLCGMTQLPANKTCEILVRGGGHITLSAGLRTETTVFRSQLGRSLDYTFFYGPKLDDVIAGYRQATGDAPMWPEWAFGFWQCRERYHNQNELLAAAAEFRRRQIPLDLIVQDWQYWTNKVWGAYEFDRSRYPDPAGMIQQLHDEHIKFMISVWCNPRGTVRAELDGKTKMLGKWIDVFDPVARDIRWKYINREFFQNGADAWWGDATEPGDNGKDMHGQQSVMGSGDSLLNAYSLFANESLYEGQRATSGEKRVCILTRSAFPGLQRYAAGIWSGDISGNWETFRRQIPAGLNFCMTGVPYWTTDCAGFWRPGDQYTSPDYNELLARWFEWSTFCPIQRIHGGNTQTEVWKWLPETQKILTDYDDLRHQLLPYVYSVSWQVSHNNSTVMRALAFDFRNDPKALATADEYLFGLAFLVAPVTTPQATNKPVYLPSGTRWINFWTGENFGGGDSVETPAPLEQIPLYVRAGSILPIGPLVQYAGEKPADPLELRIYRGADGSFTLYEDEGDNYNYERGAYSTIQFTWDDTKQALTIGKRSGNFHGMLKERTFRIVFVSPAHGVGAAPTEKPDAVIHYAGKAIAVNYK
jgi:alpha-D-xyloside xylohydrolase